MQSMDDFVTIAREVLENFKNNRSSPLWSDKFAFIIFLFFLTKLQNCDYRMWQMIVLNNITIIAVT